MITQVTSSKLAETKTCATCPNFNNHLYSESKGWCELFNLPARSYHELTNDCILNSETPTVVPDSNLDVIYANYSHDELGALSEAAFPTTTVWTDREGYPMGEQTPENAYFNPNFVTYPNEPF